MGCWNKTCGLTGLHINAGDEVLVFALEQNSEYHDRCYTTAFWRPVWVPFYSEYNDYGGGENSHGIGLDLLIKGLKEQLVEMELGDNQYHDIAVKKDELGEELFFEAVHEGRLFINEGRKGKTLVDFVMFRKDVVKDILENFCREQYVGSGKGTCGWDNAYIQYGFRDILADVPAYLDKLKESIDSAKDPILRKYAGSRGLFEHNDPNKAAMFLRDSENYRYSHLIRPFNELDELVAAGEMELAKELVEGWLTMSYLDVFMHSTRKVWNPGSHEGSQAQEHHGYRVLTKAINSALDREKEEFMEENEVEEWSDM